MTTVLVADDHPIVLEGIDHLLQTSQYSVVALCTDGQEVLRALERVAPEILVLDVKMPPPTGLEIALKLKAAGHPAKIVLLSATIGDADIIMAMQIGVEGIVLKESAPQQLIVALDAVRTGRQWFDDEVANRAVKKALAVNTSRSAADLLTPRELDVAVRVARGLRNKEIAHELGLTEGTVKFYMHNIFEKLDINSRTALANVLRENDLL